MIRAQKNVYSSCADCKSPLCLAKTPNHHRLSGDAFGLFSFAMIVLKNSSPVGPRWAVDSNV